MNDCELIFDYLAKHPGWVNAIDLCLRLKPGRPNWALRSRISDLNKKMSEWRIESRIGKNGCADYRLCWVEAQMSLAI